VPVFALDPEAYDVALVEVELCVVVAPDVDLFVFFAVQVSDGGEVEGVLGLRIKGAREDDSVQYREVGRRDVGTDKSVFGKRR
jgi:hypothetical protein